MNIAVSRPDSIVVENISAFEGCPSDRQLVFWNADGTAQLTGKALRQAQKAYLSADDGDTTDEYWYGWKIDKVPVPAYTIAASADVGGRISPSGTVCVDEEGMMQFAITPDEGNMIKAVIVDGNDVTAELADTVTRAQAGAGYYTFTNIVQNHTIHAEFERDGGDNPNPDPGGEENPKPDDGGNTNSGGGNSAGDGQMEAGTETSSVQAGSGTAPDGKEPKTGDTAYWEVYATLAMIAGLTYLLLYLMEESRGMSEREKEAFVAAFIRWGKKGGAFRKCCAMAAIFCLLMYYHTIGKRAGESVFRDKYLGQAS